MVLGIFGPFGTFELFSFGPRLIYWALVSILTFGTGAFFGSWYSGALQAENSRPKNLQSKTLQPRNWPLIVRITIIGISAGIPVVLVVWLINFVVFGIDNMTMPAMLTLGFYSIVIAMGIVVLFIMFEGKNIDGAPPYPAPDTGSSKRKTAVPLCAGSLCRDRNQQGQASGFDATWRCH